MRTSSRLGFALLCGMLCLWSCGGGGGGGSGSDKPPAVAHNEMLENLGLETVLSEAPVDKNGQALDDNPLGGTVGVIRPVKEIFQMSSGYTALVDDGKQSYRPLYALNGDTSWTRLGLKNCIGADVDGDGFEEVVMVYFVQYQQNPSHGFIGMNVVDSEGGNSFSEYGGSIAENVAVSFTTTFSQMYLPTLAKGDVDKDGREEVIIGLWNLYVVDFPSTGWPVAVTEKAYPASGLYVAAGDVDDDGQDEIVVTQLGKCDMFTKTANGPLARKFPFWDAKPPLHPMAPFFEYSADVNAAVGDIDGDGHNEIVFHGRVGNIGERENDYQVTAMRLNAAGDGFEALSLGLVTYVEYYDGRTRQYPLGQKYYPTLALLDCNGDGTVEFFARNAVWRYKPGVSGTELKDAEKLYTVNQGDPVPFVCAGDVDGDYKSDLVYYTAVWPIWDQGYRPTAMGAAGLNVLGDFVVKQAWGVTNSYPRLCLVNVDRDSPILQYTGQHELLFSKPVILAAMACPPYHAGIGQENDLTGTTFGKRVGEQIVTENSQGLSVGFSVGVELEDRTFTQSKFAAKVKASATLSRRWKDVAETSVSIAYSSGKGEDKVIFTAIPFDVYYYKVICAGGDPEVTDGATLTISVPRKPQTLAVPRDYYNQNNGDSPDVDDTVFRHTIGNVQSYPASPRTTGVWSDEYSVGLGSGYNTATIDVSTGNGEGANFDFEVGVEVETGTGGIMVGASAAYSYGFGYEVTNTRSTFYQGLVNNIPSGHPLSQYGYSWGICAYPASVGSNLFTVVNYWVQQ